MKISTYLIIIKEMFNGITLYTFNIVYVFYKTCFEQEVLESDPVKS